MQGSINVIRKDIEYGTQNAVTFQWASPINMVVTGLSHYEVLLIQNNLVKESNTTNTALVFTLEDGTYTLNVTAVNKCGERSETITSVNDINNAAAGCSGDTNIKPWQLGVAFSLFIGIGLGIASTITVLYFCNRNNKT